MGTSNMNREQTDRFKDAMSDVTDRRDNLAAKIGMRSRKDFGVMRSDRDEGYTGPLTLGAAQIRGARLGQDMAGRTVMVKGPVLGNVVL